MDSKPQAECHFHSCDLHTRIKTLEGKYERLLEQKHEEINRLSARVQTLETKDSMAKSFVVSQ